MRKHYQTKVMTADALLDKEIARINADNESLINHWESVLESLEIQAKEYSIKPLNAKTKTMYDNILSDIDGVKHTLRALRNPA